MYRAAIRTSPLVLTSSRMISNQCLSSQSTSTNPKESWLKQAKRWELESVLDGLGSASINVRSLCDVNFDELSLLQQNVTPNLKMIKSILESASHDVCTEMRNIILDELQVVDAALKNVTRSLVNLRLYAEAATDHSLAQLRNNTHKSAEAITHADICEWFGSEHEMFALP